MSDFDVLDMPHYPLSDSDLKRRVNSLLGELLDRGGFEVLDLASFVDHRDLLNIALSVNSVSAVADGLGGYSNCLFRDFDLLSDDDRRLCFAAAGSGVPFSVMADYYADGVFDVLIEAWECGVPASDVFC